MQHIAELRAVVSAFAPRLHALGDRSGWRPAPGKWSAREIIGHLVDSATNNYERFVRAQTEDDFRVTEYSQDAWVRIGGYQDANWDDLVTLWRTFNLQIARVMEATPEAALGRRLTGSNAVALRDVMIDYVRHLKHHLAQILPDDRTANAPDVHRLFETHLTVTDLDASIAFYRDIVALPLAHVTADRQAAFFWIGSRGHAMLGLWLAGPGPQRITMHVAFAASLEDVLASPRALRSAGLAPLDFDGRPTDEPVVLGWMPAASVYFRDPDGHLLEYIAMLAEEPRPDRGVMAWHAWQVAR